jgi:oxygen-independent coproporphyrinogen-3 oxidase
MSEIATELLKKYDVPVPRYTSYPTVPYWDQTPTSAQWIGLLKESLKAPENNWSLYLHIPFCETLCTFCGCNTSITKDHQREEPYLNLILQEWKKYLSELPELGKRNLQHLHLGGGTPTFLSADSLKKLISGILKDVQMDPKHFEGSIEVDPRRTNRDQLKVLKELGFNRVSLGVQDFNPEVQKLINRIQPFEITQAITDQSRELGFESVNFDLIYGLAKQTLASMKETVEKTIELRPNRIALYSFALVPWIKPAQRLFKDEDLPVGNDKRALYELSRSLLLNAGYIEVGMDHFALADDSLAIALKEQKLHRNFMGYTNQRTDVLLGLGVSAISETPQGFHQNEKVLSVYEKQIQNGEIPTHRGHLLTEMDQRRRAQILSMMTRYECRFEDAEQAQAARQFFAEMQADGLVQVTEEAVYLTEIGRPFLRNACLFFDERLRSKQPQIQTFSRSL